MRIRLIRAGQVLVAGLSTTLLLAAPVPASAGGQGADTIASPPPDRIVVDVETVNGSGCPAGSASVSVSPDNTSFRVTYRKYIARVGSGAEPVDFRKNCQLSLAIHIPQGFTYAVARADYKGFAHLRRDVTGRLRAAYYFMGSSDTLYLDHTLTGPFSDSWHATDITDVAALVFRPCGKDVNLNINTSLLVDANDSRSVSFMAMNSTAGDIDTIYHFHWKRC